MRKLWFLLLLLFLLPDFPGYSQLPDMDLPVDIQSIDINSLSDSQIRELILRLEKTGMSESELERMALLRGMQPSQINDLRRRIDNVRYRSTMPPSPERERRQLSTYPEERDSLAYSRRSYDRLWREDIPELPDFFDDLLRFSVKDSLPEYKVFGMSLFRNKKINFQPAMNIPTPSDYLLGNGDRLLIDIWGVSEMTYTKTISSEGTILIAGIGPVFLNGLTMEEARIKLNKELSKIYAGLSGNKPNTYMNVSLSSVRSIQVNLAGEVYAPGTYNLPSFSTVFNAIYSAGGPTLNGSLRKIKLIRNNKIISQIDFYQFLLEGILEGNIRLQDQDVIFIEPFISRVEIQGEIKRPGFYDMDPQETISDLIRFTGGFTGDAFTNNIKIIRKTDIENKIIDVPKIDFDKMNLYNGDLLIVDSVLNRFENRVEISGAVFRPGIYEFRPDMSLKDLIDKAEGCREDAFPDRGLIYRLKDDLTIEVIPFDKNNIIDDQHPILIKREDLIMIPSVFDLREELMVEIIGEVRQPGNYPYVENMSIEDLIIQAGGLLESASMAKIEIARRIKSSLELQSSGKIADIFQFSIPNGLKLSSESASFTLEPFDKIFIRKSPNYHNQRIMTIEGEVHFPGIYTLFDKNERISSVIQRAGGLTSFSYPPGARLVRKLSDIEIARQSVIQDLAFMSKDTVILEKEIKTVNTIGIDLEKILSRPGSKYDIFLQEGDTLIIPREQQTVSLEGAVLYSTTVYYNEQYSFTKYISQAGGFATNAKRNNSYVIHPNGTVSKTKKFIFFKSYPRIEPGSEIYVPIKEDRRKLSPTESISIFTATASMSLVLVTLINAVMK